MAKRIRTHPGEVLREEFLVPLGKSARPLGGRSYRRAQQPHQRHCA